MKVRVGRNWKQILEMAIRTNFEKSGFVSMPSFDLLRNATRKALS